MYEDQPLFDYLAWTTHLAMTDTEVKLGRHRPTRFSLLGDQLYNIIIHARKKFCMATVVCFREDIKQQIRFIWLTAEKRYKANVNGRSLKDYLIRMTILGMRDYTISLLKQTNTTNTSNFSYYIKRPQLLLDLHFVVNGTNTCPFDTLNPYERYLLFLRYNQEKTLAEIAKTVYKRVRTVQLELRFITDKLRSLANEDKDTGRFGSRGECSSITRSEQA